MGEFILVEFTLKKTQKKGKPNGFPLIF